MCCCLLGSKPNQDMQEDKCKVTTWWNNLKPNMMKSNPNTSIIWCIVLNIIVMCKYICCRVCISNHSVLHMLHFNDKLVTTIYVYYLLEQSWWHYICKIVLFRMKVWISRYFPNYKVIYMLLTSLHMWHWILQYMMDFKNRQGGMYKLWFVPFQPNRRGHLTKWTYKFSR